MEELKWRYLTLIILGQCISMFPNIIRIEDIGSDVDVWRGDAWDGDWRANAVATTIATIWSLLRTHRSGRRGHWRMRRRHACASAGERNTIVNVCLQRCLITRLLHARSYLVSSGPALNVASLPACQGQAPSLLPATSSSCLCETASTTAPIYVSVSCTAHVAEK